MGSDSHQGLTGLKDLSTSVRRLEDKLDRLAAAVDRAIETGFGGGGRTYGGGSSGGLGSASSGGTRSDGSVGPTVGAGERGRWAGERAKKSDVERNLEPKREQNVSDTYLSKG